jgi:hypothetical protein
MKNTVTDPARGLSICTSTIDGVMCTRVEWHVADPLRKFKVSCGFPLVSPPFTIGDFGEARVVFTAGSVPLAENKAATRKQNRKPANACSQFGSVQLKTSGDMVVRESLAQLHYIVGAVRQGPFDLDARTMQGCELELDWREYLEGDGVGYLRIAVELYQLEQEAEGK